MGAPPLPSLAMSDPSARMNPRNQPKGNEMFELYYLGQKVQTFRTRDAALQNVLDSAGSFGDYEILDGSDNL